LGKNRLAVFRPKLLSTDRPSGILITFRNGALVATSTSTALPTPNSGTYTGVLAAPDVTGVTYAGGTYSFAISPATITASTPQINISATVTKFGNQAGCTVKFKGAFLNDL
jgi:hypothetical protein